MEITVIELRDMLQAAAKIGAEQALADNGLLKPYLSQAEAYRKYGRATVDRWRKEGLISFEKDGTDSSKKRYSRLKLEAVAQASNRVSWYRHYKEDKFQEA